MASPKDEPPQNESGIVSIDSSSATARNNDYYSQEDIDLRKDTNDAPVWNILPSYQMYTNTIYKSLNVSDENIAEPPSYENSSISSTGQSSNTSTRPSNSALAQTYSTHQTSVVAASDDNSQRLIIADETTNLWQETVLDNIHKLTNLTYSNRAVSNSVNISIKFTKDVGELGKVPKFIDPLLHEYKQGDLINGYVLITNESNEPVPFDMFYVLFEGNFSIANPLDKESTVPLKVLNFLQMFDFSASWNHAHINRLITEYENPYDCPFIIDPNDGTSLAIGESRRLLPKVTYKRFFTFKLPENLLDSECKHNLQGHTMIPPTIGIPRLDKVMNTINKAELSKTKDFSFVGTSISYEVQARFIGRGSMYNVRRSTKNDKETLLINSKGDEYVILKELTKSLRVVPESRPMSDAEKKIMKKGNKVIYKNLVNLSKEKIELGHELLKAIDSNKIDNAIDLVSRLSNFRSSRYNNDQIKFRQLYTSDACCKKDFVNCELSNEKYNLISPYTKKSITGILKPLGTLHISTPKIEYTLKYIPPYQFRNGNPVNPSDLQTWNLRVPVDLTFHIPRSLYDKNRKLPTIKSVRSDLVVHLIKTDERMPIEITHDLLFKNEVRPDASDNKFHDLDEFSTIVKAQFLNYYEEISTIFRQLPPDTYKIERDVLRDIKSLATATVKKMNLQIEDIMYQVPGAQQSPACQKNLANIEWSDVTSDRGTKDIEQLVYNCKFDLILNVVTAHLKAIGKYKKDNAFDSFFLVPSFQLCYMARLYYAKIDITFSNGDIAHLKIPVDFEK